MVVITDVLPRSRAHKMGIEGGDILISINGKEINDVLDYRFYLADKKLKIKVQRGDKELTFKCSKQEYDDIGLDFETPLMDKKHSCENKCIFCFIDQLPKGMRSSLYFKDDDSRLSFLHGNYITLTNLHDSDIDRIIAMHISPVNVSVHTTNPELRVKMMKNKRSGEVLSYLGRLSDAGIKLCCQIVLCKGINDGEELRRSISDLAEYYPEMTSLAVVPAGLTKYRDKLYPLTDFTAEEAGAVIDLINSFGDRFKREKGERFVFAADEFYLKAGREIPCADYYEDYPQLENGVGMLRSLADEFKMCEDEEKEGGVNSSTRSVSLATGVAAYPTVVRLVEGLKSFCPNLNVNIYKIVNNFYGESITVTGLLTGKDIYEQLKDKELLDELLIPKNALRQGEDTFLCDMTVSELSEKLGVPVTPSGDDGYELCLKILGKDGA